MMTSKQKTINIDGEFDLEFIKRYRRYVDIEHIDVLHPTIIMHRNVVEYIVGLNPIIVNDKQEIRKAMRRWKQVLELIAVNASLDSIPHGEKVVIGYYYPDIYIVSAIKPRLPYVPDWIGYVSSDEVAVVKKDDINNMRKLYINILKSLSKAVIVKPLLF